MEFKASDEVLSDADTGDTTGTTESQAGAKDKAVSMENADKGSEELIAEKSAEALGNAVAAAAKEAATPDSKKVNDRRFEITIDEARDANLTEFGKETLTDRYLLPGEKYQAPDGSWQTRTGAAPQRDTRCPPA